MRGKGLQYCTLQQNVREKLIVSFYNCLQLVQNKITKCIKMQEKETNKHLATFLLMKM